MVENREKLLRGKIVLITGGSGFVGSYLVGHLQSMRAEVIAPSSSELDFTDKEQVEQFVANSTAHFIVHAGAYTNVDDAESEEGAVEAWKTNVEGTRNMAQAAKKHGKFLVYISTDFVFPGTDGPYAEIHQPADVDSKRIGNYARSKLQGEEEVRKMGRNYAIVRIGYPFGNPDSAKDFAKKTIALLDKGYPLFTDQRITPTYLPDLARALDSIIKDRHFGIFHVACQSVTTPYEFGCFMAEKLGLKEPPKGCLEKYLLGTKKAPRPFNGGLQTQLTQDILDLKFHPWQEAVSEILVPISPDATS